MARLFYSTRNCYKVSFSHPVPFSFFRPDAQGVEKHLDIDWIKPRSSRTTSNCSVHWTTASGQNQPPRFNFIFGVNLHHHEIFLGRCARNGLALETFSCWSDSLRGEFFIGGLRLDGQGLWLDLLKVHGSYLRCKVLIATALKLLNLFKMVIKDLGFLSF